MINNELCELLSLEPDQERIVLSAYFVVDLNGNILQEQFEYKLNLIKSSAKLSYSQVDDFFLKIKITTTLNKII